MSLSGVILAYRHRSREETYRRFRAAAGPEVRRPRRAAAGFLPPPRVNRMLKLSPPLTLTPASRAVSFIDNGIARWDCDKIWAASLGNAAILPPSDARWFVQCSQYNTQSSVT
jgi:hypothetical protein